MRLQLGACSDYILSYTSYETTLFAKGCGPKFRRPTDAAAHARPTGCRDLAHVSGTATARLHATVASAVGWRKVLELCSCIRFGGAAQRCRRSCARAGAAAATCSCCWCCWPWPSGQLPVGGALLDVTPSWSFAAVPRRSSGCVAPPQSSQSWTQA